MSPLCVLSSTGAVCSRLWDPAARIDRSVYPTYGQVLADQIAGADAAAIGADED